MRNHQLFSKGLLCSVAPDFVASLRQFGNDQHLADLKNKSKLNAAMEKIHHFYLLLLKNAINEQIEKDGCWVVGNSSDNKLDDEIASRYSIQLKNCDAKGRAGTFQLEFELIGEMEAMLAKYSMYNVFTVLLSNDAENYQFTCKEDVNRLFLANSDIWNSESIYSKKEFKKIYARITAHYGLNRALLRLRD